MQSFSMAGIISNRIVDFDFGELQNSYYVCIWGFDFDNGEWNKGNLIRYTECKLLIVPFSGIKI